MRRAPLILLTGAGLVALVVMVSSGGRAYKVDALFDSAKGMVPGQLVEIAGARVGTVDAVKLIRSGADGYEALMELSVQPRFAPFHGNASCRILPQGPISENYVECDPGTAASGALAPGPEGAPTIPVSHTAEALDVQDVLNVFTMPTDSRLAILLDELGIATAGRGADLNAILERVNPALDQANRVLAALRSQRAQIGNAVVQTDQILSELAGSSEGIRTFVDEAAAVTRTTAAHRPALGDAIARLPGMLTNVDRGLRSLDRVTADGTPLLRSLEQSAPGLTALTDVVPRFIDAGSPALNALGPVARVGEQSLTAARPVVQQLERFGTTEGSTAYALDHLLTSSRDAGAIEQALLILYGITANDAAYDNVSHFLSVLVQVFPQCILDVNLLGCKHTYDSPGQGTLPVNDPSSGPLVDGAPPAGQPSQAPTSTPTVPAQPAPASQTQARALIEYLLK